MPRENAAAKASRLPGEGGVEVGGSARVRQVDGFVLGADGKRREDRLWVTAEA
jgi:hypothetical protein